MDSEFTQKIEKVRELLHETGAGGIEVCSQANFSWLTGGRGFVGLASENACASLLVTPDDVWLLANNIEKPRLLEEEIAAVADGVKTASFPWHDFSGKACAIRDILGGRECLTDARLAGQFQRLRSKLTEGEVLLYRELGASAAEAVEDVCRGLRLGASEFDIAGMASDALWRRGIEPITLLVAFDERISRYRHPLPTGKKLAKYAMVVVCERRHGLVASLTRLASLGPQSEEIARKHRAVAQVDACFISSTRPGAKARDIFAKAVSAYRTAGFPGEWELHHQGGLTGYNAREYIATNENASVVEANQAFAWNPSITGTKSEDTILVLAEENRIVTHTGKYVYMEAEYENETMLRPDILIL